MSRLRRPLGLLWARGGRTAGEPVSSGGGRPLLERFAALIVRKRHAVVAAWILLALLLALLLPSLEEAKDAPLGGLVPDDSASVETAERSFELFRFPVLADTAVVQRDPEGLSRDALIRVYERAYSLTSTPDPDATGIVAIAPVTNGSLFPFSRERSTTAVSYLFVEADRTLRNRVDLAHLFSSRYVDRPDDAYVGVTGVVPAQVEQIRIIGESLDLVELATVAVLATIVAVTFRALAAPLVTLLAAAIGYVVATRSLAALGAASGVAVPRELEPLVVVLLLAMVTDYCIFFFSDLRARLRRGTPGLRAAEEATTGTAHIVLTAGLIVAAGSAVLLAGTLGFFRAFGPGLAITALVGVAVSATLVPALMAILGRGLFWPNLRRARDGDGEPASAGPGALPRRIREPTRQLAQSVSQTDDRLREQVRASGARMTRTALRRPVATLVVSVVFLGALATGLSQTTLGLTLIRGLPETAEPRRAAAAVNAGFAPGVLSPTELLVEGPRVVERVEALVRLQEMLERRQGVAAVIGPRQNPTGRVFGAVYSPTGDAARYLIVLDHVPLGGRAIQRLDAIEAALPTLVTAAGLGDARASLTGVTALASETVSSTVSDLGRIALAAALVNFVLLAAFLRSAVAPLYLLATSVLALTASLGLTVYVFEGILGYEETTYFVPFVAAVLLLALGSDYNVFVVGRVWQEARDRSLREAVQTAAPRAAQAVSAAGLALAASFALLALVPLRPFREFAFAMTVGVLIETFVVRTLLVPALIVIFGPASRWPSRPPAPTTGATPSDRRPARPGQGEEAPRRPDG